MDKLTGESIRKAEFSPQWKGYSLMEVDTFVEHVAVGVDALQERIRELLQRPTAANVGDRKSVV